MKRLSMILLLITPLFGCSASIGPNPPQPALLQHIQLQRLQRLQRTLHLFLKQRLLKQDINMLWAFNMIGAS